MRILDEKDRKKISYLRIYVPRLPEEKIRSFTKLLNVSSLKRKTKKHVQSRIQSRKLTNRYNLRKSVRCNNVLSSQNEIIAENLFNNSSDFLKNRYSVSKNNSSQYNENQSFILGTCRKSRREDNSHLFDVTTSTKNLTNNHMLKDEDNSNDVFMKYYKTKKLKTGKNVHLKKKIESTICTDRELRKKESFSCNYKMRTPNYKFEKCSPKCTDSNKSDKSFTYVSKSENESESFSTCDPFSKSEKCNISLEFKSVDSIPCKDRAVKQKKKKKSSLTLSSTYSNISKTKRIVSHSILNSEWIVNVNSMSSPKQISLITKITNKTIQNNKKKNCESVPVSKISNTDQIYHFSDDEEINSKTKQNTDNDMILSCDLILSNNVRNSASNNISSGSLTLNETVDFEKKQTKQTIDEPALFCKLDLSSVRSINLKDTCKDIQEKKFPNNYSENETVLLSEQQNLVEIPIRQSRTNKTNGQSPLKLRICRESGNSFVCKTTEQSNDVIHNNRHVKEDEINESSKIIISQKLNEPLSSSKNEMKAKSISKQQNKLALSEEQIIIFSKNNEECCINVPDYEEPNNDSVEMCISETNISNEITKKNSFRILPHVELIPINVSCSSDVNNKISDSEFNKTDENYVKEISIHYSNQNVDKTLDTIPQQTLTFKSKLLTSKIRVKTPTELGCTVCFVDDIKKYSEISFQKLTSDEQLNLIQKNDVNFYNYVLKKFKCKSKKNNNVTVKSVIDEICEQELLPCGSNLRKNLLLIKRVNYMSNINYRIDMHTKNEFFNIPTSNANYLIPVPNRNKINFNRKVNYQNPSIPVLNGRV